MKSNLPVLKIKFNDIKEVTPEEIYVSEDNRSFLIVKDGEVIDAVHKQGVFFKVPGRGIIVPDAWVEYEEGQNKIGTIHNKGTMIIRKNMGDAENGDVKLEMSLANFTTPCLLSKKTGKMFILSWQEIISLALEAGIEE